MTEMEVSQCVQKCDNSFFEQNRDMDMPVARDRVDDRNNGLVLASREERAALLRTGLTGKDIESLYLRFNGIIVIGTNWQDLKS